MDTPAEVPPVKLGPLPGLPPLQSLDAHPGLVPVLPDPIVLAGGAPAGVLPGIPPVVLPQTTFTAEQIEALARSPLSVSGDTGSRTARSADDIRDLIALAEELRRRSNVGGRRSGWSGIMAKAVPPGTV